ncbi:hypothetical protein J1605_013590 [Eschrichtius robustus]|uniref:Uncharacterized protein n=1 Tax=Eschrichtius robustus TaxID=9764 RepID=A0AB34GH34_ESCRO|nr:hypothetical protein J1605_013590 [Eschrichtius robustus]
MRVTRTNSNSSPGNASSQFRGVLGPNCARPLPSGERRRRQRRLLQRRRRRLLLLSGGSGEDPGLGPRRPEGPAPSAPARPRTALSLRRRASEEMFMVDDDDNVVCFSKSGCERNDHFFSAKRENEPVI